MPEDYFEGEVTVMMVEQYRHRIVSALNSLEALGVPVRFRAEDGWGQALYIGNYNFLSWNPDSQTWEWVDTRES